MRHRPYDAEAFIRRAEAHLRAHDYDQAIEDYGRSLELDPTSALAFNNRGYAHLRKGEYEKAIRDFDQAIKLNSNHANSAFHNRATAFTCRGDACTERGEFARAIEDYDQAIRLDVDDPVAATYNASALHGRGVARTWLGEYECAIHDFDDAMRFDSTFYEAFFSRGIAHLKAKQPIAAVADFNADLVHSPRDAFALYGRSLAYRSTGDEICGNADIAAAIALDAKIVGKFKKIFDL